MQLMVRAGLELWISRFQFWRSNHSVTLPPLFFFCLLFFFASSPLTSYLVKNREYGSRLQKNMKRKVGRREGAGRKKSPVLAKITREINQKYWRANHHYLYLENRVFSTWRNWKVRANGTFVNDSNFASCIWLLKLQWFRPQSRPFAHTSYERKIPSKYSYQNLRRTFLNLKSLQMWSYW